MFKNAFINNRAMREVYRLAGDDYSNIVVDDYDSKIIALTHLSGLTLCNKKSLRFMAEELESYAHSVENKLKKFNGQNLDDYEEFKEFAKELTALEKDGVKMAFLTTKQASAFIDTLKERSA